MALISIDQLNDRLGRTLTGDEETQASAFIDDASALVLQIADLTTDWTDVTLPAAVVPVVTSMVRRAIDNPDGLIAEQIGEYRWQADSGQGTIYATRGEVRIIRKAASRLGAGTAQLEGYFPDRSTGSAFEDAFIDAIYESADA
ncbi:MAG TPA: hypothetical protein VFK56_00645 [Mycobacterium sp.]|jgi:hypothetical protein|nr:hypothetical protein [Mycobacterium sp.]